MSSNSLEKKKRNRRRVFITYGVFAALIIAPALYLIFRNTDRIQYRLPNIPSIDIAGIDEITVESEAKGTVRLKRSGDSWLLAPEGYEIDPDLLSDILDEIEGFSVTDLVSTAGYYERYDLDEPNRYEVTVSSSGNVKLQFDVGKRSPTYNHTYVLIAGDDRVFQAPGNLQSIFGKDVAALRNKLVFSIDPETVTRIGVTTPESSYRLYRSIEDEKTKWTSSEDETEWDPEGVENVLNRITSLECQAYLDDTDLPDPSIVLEIQGEKIDQLFIFDKTGSSYRARSSQSPYVFTISSYTAEEIIDEFSETESGS